jgi:predicted P-loop ATPase
MEPGCWWRTAPVLVGGQGTGKTEWVRTLAGDDWFLSGVGKLDKEALARLRRAWLVELGELDGITRKSDQEHLKAFLTERVDVFRVVWAKTDEPFPRRCVFIGTANGAPLRDPTGSSRFAVINTGQVELPVGWVRENRAALWARALEQYRAGMPWTHTPDEQAAIADRNSGFTVVDPWHEELENRLHDLARTGQPIQTTDVYRWLAVDVPQQNNQTAERVGRILQALGWSKGQRRIDGKPVRGWWPPQRVTAVTGASHPWV